MTILHGKNVNLYVNGLDISGDVNEVTPKSEIELADVTTFGSTGHRYYPGLTKDEFSYKGLFNPIAGYLYSQLTTLFQTATTYGVMIIKAAANPAVVGDSVSACEGVMLNKVEAKAVTTDVLRLDASFKVEDHPFENGILAMVKAQKSLDWTGTSINNAADSHLGAIGYVQVFEQTGGTGCTLSLIHSTSGAWAGEETELMTFGNFATAGCPTSKRVDSNTLLTPITTVKQYVKVKGVFAGGGPYTVTAAIAIVRL